MSEIRKKIAKLLKYYRENAGLTVREAGKLLGKSHQTVSAWENERGQPDADMFLKLCKIYGVESVSVFFGENVPDLPKDEKELLKEWREASDSAKESAIMVLQSNKKSQIERKKAI